MTPNPKYRYAAVPVERPLAREPVVYIVRMQNKEDALRLVARTVDADALIDRQNTRTFDTKHQAEDYAKQKGWGIAEHVSVTSPKAANHLKKKLLRG